ncbi:hypothetical protein M0804_002587 [Polistes exclamans]|nr:hypothetical protein M0804_002587 [Polistes exclamans]
MYTNMHHSLKLLLEGIGIRRCSRIEGCSRTNESLGTLGITNVSPIHLPLFDVKRYNLLRLIDYGDIYPARPFNMLYER